MRYEVYNTIEILLIILFYFVINGNKICTSYMDYIIIVNRRILDTDFFCKI